MPVFTSASEEEEYNGLSKIIFAALFEPSIKVELFLSPMLSCEYVHMRIRYTYENCLLLRKMFLSPRWESNPQPSDLR